MYNKNPLDTYHVVLYTIVSYKLPIFSLCPAHLCHVVLRSSEDMDDWFGMVAVIVLSHVRDSREGWRRRWGQNGWYGVSLWGLEDLFLYVAFYLRTRPREREGEEKKKSPQEFVTE